MSEACWVRLEELTEPGRSVTYGVVTLPVDASPKNFAGLLMKCQLRIAVHFFVAVSW
jgi:hypothetical protein